MLCTNVPGWCTLYEYVNLFCDIIDILSKRWLKREREREREREKKRKKKKKKRDLTSPNIESKLSRLFTHRAKNLIICLMIKVIIELFKSMCSETLWICNNNVFPLLL